MSKRHIAIIAILIGASGLLADDAKPQESLGVYQSILDRMPFGPEPRGFDPEALPGSGNSGEGGGMTEEQRTEEEQKLAANVRVSVLNVTPAGKVAVGFTDSSANPPCHYYLLVGQSRDGWTVDEADPAEQSVTLSKDGVNVTLGLGESSGGGKSGKTKATSGSGRMSSARHSPIVTSVASPAPAMSGGLSALRARRKQREAVAAEQEAQRKSIEEAAKREREAAIQAAAQEREAAAAEREQQKQELLQLREQIRADLKRKQEEKTVEPAEKAETEESDGEGNAHDDN